MIDFFTIYIIWILFLITMFLSNMGVLLTYKKTPFFISWEISFGFWVMSMGCFPLQEIYPAPSLVLIQTALALHIIFLLRAIGIVRNRKPSPWIQGALVLGIGGGLIISFNGTSYPLLSPLGGLMLSLSYFYCFWILKNKRVHPLLLLGLLINSLIWGGPFIFSSINPSGAYILALPTLGFFLNTGFFIQLVQEQNHEFQKNKERFLMSENEILFSRVLGGFSDALSKKSLSIRRQVHQFQRNRDSKDIQRESLQLVETSLENLYRIFRDRTMLLNAPEEKLTTHNLPRFCAAINRIAQRSITTSKTEIVNQQQEQDMVFSIRYIATLILGILEILQENHPRDGSKIIVPIAFSREGDLGCVYMDYSGGPLVVPKSERSEQISWLIMYAQKFFSGNISEETLPGNTYRLCISYRF